MDISSIFTNFVEPRTVMVMGCLVAFVTAAMLQFQSDAGGTYRRTLNVLVAAIALNGLSLVIFACYFDEHFVRQTLFAIMAASASFVVGAFCLIFVYRPNFPTRLCWFYGLVCLSGYLFWQEIPSARHWNNFCQFGAALLTITIIVRSPDPLAPGLRKLALGICGLSVLAMLPRMLTLMQPDLDPSISVEPVVTVGYRLRLMIWALFPILLYACITSIIHARMSAKLRDAADLDILTGAYSRRYLFERGAQILDHRDAQHAEATAVLLIDVDHFKTVNDQWGHLVGDSVLKHCVDCIRQVVRRDDVVIGRYGGEEFCILVPKVAQRDAFSLAERIRSQLAESPYRKGDISVPVTVSIGVAESVVQTSLEALIRLADERLYRAKNGGRNQVVDEGGLLVPI